jgi:hypothetical protein
MTWTVLRQLSILISPVRAARRVKSYAGVEQLRKTRGESFAQLVTCRRNVQNSLQMSLAGTRTKSLAAYLNSMGFAPSCSPLIGKTSRSGVSVCAKLGLFASPFGTPFYGAQRRALSRNNLAAGARQTARAIFNVQWSTTYQFALPTPDRAASRKTEDAQSQTPSTTGYATLVRCYNVGKSTLSR